MISRWASLGVLPVATLLLVACAASSAPQPSASPSATASPSASATSSIDIPGTWSAVVDPTAIPLGDDAISASPVVGDIFSCKTDFSGRGAIHTGPWIDYENNTWDSTAKVSVSGSTIWAEAIYQESVDGEHRVITSLDLPVDDPTGTFPISRDDPAHQFDPNPNEIVEHSVELSVPLNPMPAAAPSCVAMGAVGVIINGVFLYNALDGSGGDAVAHETQDVCDGHPDGADAYHYHDIPSCVLDELAPGSSTLVGYALDGYGIYVERDSLGNLPTNADLDECHGRTSTVLFNGTEQELYHYSATLEYPFTIGCFRGTPVAAPKHG